MIEFILNNQKIITSENPGISLLDFIRNDQRLFGTKSGCREGDCGACTVLEGSIVDGVLIYKSIVSCLTPLVNAHAKHIVTIEGLNLEKLSPVQNSIANNSATQCGFCTPGFVVALTGHLMSVKNYSSQGSIGGNLCRCTGYKSIERAAEEVDKLKTNLLKGSEIEDMIKKGWLPEYFSNIMDKLLEIKVLSNFTNSQKLIIAGGTDLLVTQSEKVADAEILPLRLTNNVNIYDRDDYVEIGASITISEFAENEIITNNFPFLSDYYPLIASEQIRNMGTLAGNIVNASPIGDFTILFLALDTELVIENMETLNKRKLKLNEFYIDYKLTALKRGEIVKNILIKKINKTDKFNFEKVSKRTYLDIASVNSAIWMQIKENVFVDIRISVGGLSPIPKLLNYTCNYLKGKKANIKNLNRAIFILQGEINPISDIRGSKEYKRLLIRQLLIKHFMKLIPNGFTEAEILQLMFTNIVANEKY